METGNAHLIPSDEQECFSEEEAEQFASVLRGELGEFSMIPEMMPDPDSVELVVCEPCFEPPLMS